MRLENKVALITGAGRGIGRECALRFAAEGAAVGVLDRDEEPAAELAARIQQAGGRALALGCDVRDARRCREGVEMMVQHFGSLHILVNNAGITRDAVLHKMTDEQWDTLMDIHVKGCFNTCRAVAPYFRQPGHGGSIVNVSSVSAQKGNPGQTNYAAAKAAIIGFTRSLANEWARFGVRVNAVAFGFIDTRLTQPKETGEEVEGEALGIPAALRQHILAQIPLGRIGTVREAVAAILFLAGDEAGYITGQTLNVNGGSYML